MRLTPDRFITPEQFDKLKFKELSGPNGWLLFVACNAGLDLATKVKVEYERMLSVNESSLRDIPLLHYRKDGSPITLKHADSETVPRLPGHVAGSDVYVFQNLSSRLDGQENTNDNFMQLLQVIRTLKVHRAKTITAVTPYHAYSRQDRPSFGKREATLTKLNADLIITAGVDQVLTYHLHNDSIHGFYEPKSIIGLTGLHYFVTMFQEFTGREDVIAVPTDAGGAKYTVMFASEMGIDYGMAGKSRKTGSETDLLGIVGDFSKKRIAIVCDDETVTFGSYLNLIKKLNSMHPHLEIHGGISHNKISESGLAKIMDAHEKYGLKTLHITDSIPQPPAITQLPFIIKHPLEQLWVYAINRLHYNQSLRDVFLRR